MRQLVPADLLRAVAAGEPGLVDESWWCALDGADGLPATMAFRTSGTTGPPRRWLRDRASLTAEADLLIAGLGLAGAGAVISFAPPVHLYGFAAGIVLAARLRVPLIYISLRRLAAPPMIAAHTVVTALPASLKHLDRVVRRPPGGRVTVLHSTARLPEGWWASPLATDPAVTCHELLGSTESGLVATRPAGRREGLWRLVDDVSFAPSVQPGAAVPLAVTGPRLARAAGRAPLREAVLDDLVVATDQRSFRRLGRHTRLVKVNGRRVHLDDLERTLSGHTGLELACRPVPDPLRGEWFVVDVVGDTAAASALERLCRRLLPPGCQPRAVRPVARLARGVTGKILAATMDVERAGR